MIQQKLAKITAVVICLVASAFVGCESNDSAATEFHAGRTALMKGEFQLADQKLTRFVNHWPGHVLCSRAWFLRAKTQVGIGDLDQASALFQETIRLYPDSEETHKSRYKLAVIKLLQGHRIAARKAFQDVIDHSPGTLVPEANAMVLMLSEESAVVAVEPDTVAVDLVELP